jgi:hypothetical protein
MTIEGNYESLSEERKIMKQGIKVSANELKNRRNIKYFCIVKSNL